MKHAIMLSSMVYHLVISYLHCFTLNWNAYFNKHLVFYRTRVYQMQPRNGQNWHSSVGKYVHQNRKTTEGFCTSLKSISISGFVDTRDKSMQISFKSVLIFLTIRRKTWQAQLENCQNQNSHTSKIICLLQVCLRNNRHIADHISNQYAKFYRKR